MTKKTSPRIVEKTLGGILVSDFMVNGHMFPECDKCGLAHFKIKISSSVDEDCYKIVDTPFVAVVAPEKYQECNGA